MGRGAEVRRIFIATAAALVAAFAFHGRAGAQVMMLTPIPCGQTGATEQRLLEKYGEAPLFEGVAGGTNTVTVWWNRTTGTFTLLSRRPNGLTCVLAAGQGAGVPKSPPPKPADPT